MALDFVQRAMLTIISIAVWTTIVGFIAGIVTFVDGLLIWVCGIMILVGLFFAQHLLDLEKEIESLEDRRRRDYDHLNEQVYKTDEILEDFIKETRGYLEKVPGLESPKTEGPLTRKERTEDLVQGIYSLLSDLEEVLDEEVDE